jgi:uncharacterized protein (TIGR00251 family)
VVTDLFEIDNKGDVLLRLHVQPGAGRSAVVGRHGDALKVRVAAPPRDGRANDACVALIAETLGAKKADVELVSGQASRTKRVRVRGVEAQDVERLLEGALGNTSRGPGV